MESLKKFISEIALHKKLSFTRYSYGVKPVSVRIEWHFGIPAKFFRHDVEARIDGFVPCNYLS